MSEFSKIGKGKSTFIFELDNVLYPERDYDLQVFYLFANFLEYTGDIPDAANLTDFLKTTYEVHGIEGLFDHAAKVFNIDEKYRDHFNRVRVNAQLPLRLLVYPEMLRLLHSIRQADKSIYLLTKGNPLMQLNKIKYVDWDGLEKDLKLYFYDEIKVIKRQEPLQYLMVDNKLEPKEILFIGYSEQEHSTCKELGVDFLNVSLLLK